MFQEFEAPRFQDSQHMKVVRLSALRTGRLNSSSAMIRYSVSHCTTIQIKFGPQRTSVSKLSELKWVVIFCINDFRDLYLHLILIWVLNLGGMQRDVLVGCGTVGVQTVKKEAISTFTTPVIRHDRNIILVLRQRGWVDWTDPGSYWMEAVHINNFHT